MTLSSLSPEDGSEHTNGSTSGAFTHSLRLINHVLDTLRTVGFGLDTAEEIREQMAQTESDSPNFDHLAKRLIATDKRIDDLLAMAQSQIVAVLGSGVPPEAFPDTFRLALSTILTQTAVEIPENKNELHDDLTRILSSMGEHLEAVLRNEKHSSQRETLPLQENTWDNSLTKKWDHPKKTHIKAKEICNVHIRWMLRRDMPEILCIENAGSAYPWTAEDFLQALRQRNCIGVVAENMEKVTGFMLYELHKNKLHILNFAVHPELRHRNIGLQMVKKLKSKLSSHRRTRITLELRETNLPAQLFFQKQEFKATKVLRNFYDYTGEDAFCMEYRYGDNDEPDDAFQPQNRIAKYEEE